MDKVLNFSTGIVPGNIVLENIGTRELIPWNIYISNIGIRKPIKGTWVPGYMCFRKLWEHGYWGTSVLGNTCAEKHG